MQKRVMAYRTGGLGEGYTQIIVTSRPDSRKRNASYLLLKTPIMRFRSFIVNTNQWNSYQLVLSRKLLLLLGFLLCQVTLKAQVVMMPSMFGVHARQSVAMKILSATATDDGTKHRVTVSASYASGSSMMDEYGICMDTVPDPARNALAKWNTSGKGTFNPSFIVDNLDGGTVYYIRPFVKIGTQITYGDQTTVLTYTGNTARFYAVGHPQIFTVPAGVTSLTIECIGAQGGFWASPSGPNQRRSYGGYGAYVRGSLPVQPGQKLYVYAGGGSVNPYFNGGGGGAVIGGGASDVRTRLGDLSSREVVAGGGGGSAYMYGTGGSASGVGGTAGAGSNSGNFTGASNGGWGATSGGGGTGGGKANPAYDFVYIGGNGYLGQGGQGGAEGGAGGGGGYYGGGGGAGTYAIYQPSNLPDGGGGGGGSSYVSPRVINLYSTGGYNGSDSQVLPGRVVITF